MGCSIGVVIETKDDKGAWKYLLSSFDDEWEQMFEYPFYMRDKDIMRLVVTEYGYGDENKEVPMLSKKIGHKCEIKDRVGRLIEPNFDGYIIIGLEDADIKTKNLVVPTFDTSTFFWYYLHELLNEENHVMDVTINVNSSIPYFFKWLHDIERIVNGKKTRILFDLG